MTPELVQTREDFLRKLKYRLRFDIHAIEIGVFRGEFSEMILRILDPVSLALIDPFTVNEEKYRDGSTTAYSTEEDRQALMARIGHCPEVTIDARFSYDAAPDYPDGKFGMIYLDGCHLYEAVRRDLNDWKGKLRSHGFLCGHDYVEFADFGVRRAVDEFCGKNDFEMVLLNINGGDFALRNRA